VSGLLYWRSAFMAMVFESGAPVAQGLSYHFWAVDRQSAWREVWALLSTWASKECKP